MQREIKFRAWCHKNKKFAFEGFHVVGEVSLFGLLLEYSLEEQVKLEVTEWTGRLDKNSKGIYEGDIVKIKKRLFDWSKPDGEEEYLEDKFGSIVFIDHGFWVDSEGFGWEGEDMWDWNEIEVIGNIYENPDLLNNKNQ